MTGMVRPVADERDGLLTFLAEQRRLLKATAAGLTDDQARLSPLPGPLTIAGLIKHAGRIERYWIDLVFRRAGVSDYAEGVVLEPLDALAGLIEDYDDIARDTAVALGPVSDFGESVPVPRGMPGFANDVENVSVRWVLLHLIQETARHAGHAEEIRMAIDGPPGHGP